MHRPPKSDDSEPPDFLDESERLPHPLERPPRERLAETAPKPKAILQMPAAHEPYFTYAMILVNVILFVWGFLTPSVGEQMILQGGNFAPGIFRSGEYYRLLTAMFLHSGPAHIFFNMLILYSIGINIEKLFGTTRFALIYLLGGVAGSLLSALLGFYGSYSIGASGAIFAVLTAEAVFLYQHRRILGPDMRSRLQSLAFWSVLNLLLGFFATGIDNWGHIGGLIGGGILAWFLAPFFAPVSITETNGILVYTLADVNPLYKRWWFVGVYLSFLLVLLLFGVLFVGR